MITPRAIRRYYRRKTILAEEAACLLHGWEPLDTECNKDVLEADRKEMFDHIGRDELKRTLTELNDAVFTKQIESTPVMDKEEELFRFLDTGSFIAWGRARKERYPEFPYHYYPILPDTAVTRQNPKEWIARATDSTREMDAARGEHGSLLEIENKANAPGERSTKTYLNVIGGLLVLMLGKSPSGNPQSSFENQGAIIEAMLAHYGHIKGMGDSNLQKIMAEANKTLSDSDTRGS